MECPKLEWALQIHIAESESLVSSLFKLPKMANSIQFCGLVSAVCAPL